MQMPSCCCFRRLSLPSPLVAPTRQSWLSSAEVERLRLPSLADGGVRPVRRMDDVSRMKYCSRAREDGMATGRVTSGGERNRQRSRRVVLGSGGCAGVQRLGE